MYGGGYADVFQGRMGETTVAIKRVRRFVAIPADSRASARNVCFLFLCTAT